MEAKILPPLLMRTEIVLSAAIILLPSVNTSRSPSHVPRFLLGILVAGFSLVVSRWESIQVLIGSQENSRSNVHNVSRLGKEKRRVQDGLVPSKEKREYLHPPICFRPWCLRLISFLIICRVQSKKVLFHGSTLDATSWFHNGATDRGPNWSELSVPLIEYQSGFSSLECIDHGEHLGIYYCMRDV